MKHAQLVILSGPSGVGKDTIVKGVMEKMENVGLSVSYTTRPKRKNNGVWEQDGVEYWFLKSREMFEQEVEKGTFLEYALYGGEWYGTSQRYLEQLEQQGCDTIFLTIETRGAAQVKARDPRAVSIFLMPPTPQALVERLEGRGSEAEKKRRKRLAEGVEEVKRAYNYDYIVVNDDLEKAVDEVICIIRSVRLRTASRLEEADRVNRLFMELDPQTYQ